MIKEINYAQSLQKPILPVMAMATHLPVQLADLQYIDLSSNYENGKTQLITHVRQLAQSLEQYRSGAKPRSQRRRLRLRPRIGARLAVLLTVAAMIGILAYLTTVNLSGISDTPNRTIVRRPTDQDTDHDKIEPLPADMVVVPPGCFSPEPAEELCIDNAYWIDRTEVSRAQYGRCVIAGVCPKAPIHEDSSHPEQPVTGITWEEAQRYCEWRGARLPAEHEWVFAAKGPDSLTYPWGNEFDADVVVWRGSRSVTAPVDSYEAGASWVGALHMAGNVWEYVDATDEFRPDAFVMRGGSYISEADEVTTSARDVMPPELNPREFAYAGFRCLSTEQP